MNRIFGLGEILLLLVGSVLLQVTSANYFPAGLYFDLPLVLTLFIGWYSPPAKGALWGTLFGLLQDVSQMAPYWGLNGLSKTLIGFGSSQLRKWFLLGGFSGWFAVILVASLFDGCLVNGWLSLAGERIPPSYWSDTALRSLITASGGASMIRFYHRFKFPQKDFRRF
ncbi:MAG: rod shape-determining protein MreD [Acidobacteriota bacterium]